MSSVSGSNILITGGASGIGRLVALRLARRGGRLVIWDVNATGVADVLAQLREVSKGGAHGFVCDVSNRQQVYDTAEQVRREVGPIHILINNAGVVSGKSFLELHDAQIERTMAVNTMALFWTLKSFLPAMVEAGAGHLVTIASAAGTIGVAGLADYCASKWAAVALDESLRVELKRIAPRVRTTVVCPYFIDTGMFRGVRSRFPLLLPILSEQYVADRIVRAIERNRARVMLPRLVWLVPLLRMLPTRLFDGLASLLGINVAMDTFQGRR